MEKKINMPKLAPEMESGVLCAWLKEEGDTVAQGEAIAVTGSSTIVEIRVGSVAVEPLTVLRDECEQLEAQIEELANEHDHLVIDFETQYNISRLAAWAEETPGLVRAEPETPEIAAADRAEIVPTEDEDGGWAKISDAISTISEYFAPPAE